MALGVELLDSESAERAQREVVTRDIRKCLEAMGCQPILFVGSGLSRRFFSAPSWNELLKYLADGCPLIQNDFAYFKQTLDDPLLIGETFAKFYQEWAWKSGRNEFPKEMFSENVPISGYLKYKICEYLLHVTPNEIESLDTNIAAEISALKSIKPHAIITTNYDRFLELMFPEYQPVIGQSIIRGSQVLLGEIFKIHGCVSDYDSIVFTKSDYDEFMDKKQYLSAKLLTYFTEHPLCFVGYSAEDPNIKAILSDIDRCIERTDNDSYAIPNMFLLEWNHGHAKQTHFHEKPIMVGKDRYVRLKSIETEDFSWVFAAFASLEPLNAVSPRVLRALLHRSYDLVRHDVPRKTLQVDFQMLERAVDTNLEFAKLFGITTIDDPSAMAANYPYTLSDIAERITGKKGTYWSAAQKYLDKIKEEKGVDLKSSDNKYHMATKAGKKAIIHKYSDQMISLIDKIKSGEAYSVEI